MRFAKVFVLLFLIAIECNSQNVGNNTVAATIASTALPQDAPQQQQQQQQQKLEATHALASNIAKLLRRATTQPTTSNLLGASTHMLETPSASSPQTSDTQTSNLPAIFGFLRNLMTIAPTNQLTLMEYAAGHPGMMESIVAVVYVLAFLFSLAFGVRIERHFDKANKESWWRVMMLVFSIAKLVLVILIWVAFGKIRAAGPDPDNASVAATSAGANKDATLASLAIFEAQASSLTCTSTTEVCATLGRYGCNHVVYGSGQPALCGWCLLNFASNDLPGPGNSQCATITLADTTLCATVNRQPTDPRYRKSNTCGECLPGFKPPSSFSAAAFTTSQSGSSQYIPDAPSVVPCTEKVSCANVADVMCQDLNREVCGGHSNRDNMCGPCKSGFVNPVVGEWSDVSGLTSCVSSAITYSATSNAYCRDGKVCINFGSIRVETECSTAGGTWATCTGGGLSSVPAQKCLDLQRADDKGLGLNIGCGDCKSGYAGSRGPTLINDCFQASSGSPALYNANNMAPFWNRFSIATAANPRLLPFSPDTSRTIFDYEFVTTAFPLRVSAFRPWKLMGDAITANNKEFNLIIKGKFSTPLVSNGARVCVSIPSTDTKYCGTYDSNSNTMSSTEHQAQWTFNPDSGEFSVSGVTWSILDAVTLCTNPAVEVQVRPVAGNLYNVRTYRIWAVQPNGMPCYGSNPIVNVYG